MNMLSEYNSFTLENQDNKILQYNRVVMMDKVGFISGALAEYESMMSGDTESALLFNNRGVARMKTNRLVEAEADFNEAIKKDPKLAEPYFNLAIINAYKGFPNKTIDNLKKAIKMDSSLEKGIEANPAFDVVRTNPKFKKAFN
jgi:tetratricopeptide (TPR) repeat protein